MPPRDELNTFFTEVGSIKTNASETLDATYQIPRQSASLFLTPVSSQEVYRIVRRLRTKNSLDVDNLSTKILQCGSEYLAEPLADILNTCFEEGLVPDGMKMAKVTPILKKRQPDRMH